MTVKLLTEHYLEFLSLKGGCTGSSESTLVKMPHCWKSHVIAHLMSIPGGLLIALPREQAAAFCKDIEKQEGYQAWIVGIVEKGNRTARIIDKPRVIEVPAKDREGELW